MTTPRFHYLSPKILPLFPSDVGGMRFISDPQFILNIRALRKFTGTVAINVSHFVDGAMVQQSEQTIQVISGNAKCNVECVDLGAPGLGYAEITFSSSERLFGKIIPEPGYAVLSALDRGPITVNADWKFSNTRVIDQIRQYGKFCMIHSAALVDKAHGIGNSVLLMNPYEQPLVARAVSATGRKWSGKLAPRTVLMLDLVPLLDDAVPSTIMISGSYSNWKLLNSIDHLDPFSGILTHRPADVFSWSRAQLRRIARATGIKVN